MTKSPPTYCEFTRASLKVLAGRDSAEFPLERAPDGSLTAASRDTVSLALKQFLKNAGRPPGSPVWAGLDARGVSLRCLLLPSVAAPGMEQLVRLQIETEFPLPPDELAWGFRLQGELQRQPDGTLKQAVLVAAVKKEIISQYADILTAAGLVPTFTISALARAELCAPAPAAFAVLDLGPAESELACFAGDAQALVRRLPPAVEGDAASLTDLTKAIGTHWPGPKLYIFGPVDAAAQIIRQLPVSWACEHLRTVPSGSSSAILGLKKLAEEQGSRPLILQLAAAPAPRKMAEPALVAWSLRAVFLLVAVLLFPTFEALVCTAPLATQVSKFQSQATNLEATVDHELGFLQTLKQSQPPYVESFYIISQAAPPGIQLESLSLNRHGEMSLRASLRTGDEVAEFRAKLIASGCFASVTVEEQTPTPDHQKVNIRMTGQCKPIAQLQGLPVGPAPAELGTNASPSAPTGPRAAPGAAPILGMEFLTRPLYGGAH